MKVFDPKDFGAFLRQRRRDLKYTQSDLAEITGFSVSFISDLENGKATAELGKAMFLANILGLDVSMSVRGG